MRKISRIYLWVGVGLGLAIGSWACKPIRNLSQQKIINGSVPVTAGPVKNSTVALALLGPDGQPGAVFCTGVVIAPDAVLTASQCLENIKDLGTPEWGLILDQVAPTVFVKVKMDTETSQFLTDGSRDYPSLNLAVIRPSTKITADRGYTPVEILRDPSVLGVNTEGEVTSAMVEVLIAGYGRQDNNCLSAKCNGLLTEAKSYIDAYTDRNHLLGTLLVMAKQDKTGSVCFGDAGGPAFMQVNGKYYLAGIASGSLRRGPSALSAEASRQVCDNGLAAYAFVGDYLGWLNNTVKLNLTAFNEVDNKARASLGTIDSTALADKPTSVKSWASWIAFNNFKSASFGTVSFLQQKLMENEALRTDATKLKDSDFFLNPAGSELRAQAMTELQLVIDKKALPNSRQLKNLEPLAAFSGLTKLTIDGMAIDDFSALGSLTNLTSLKILSNGTQALTPLGSLVGLGSLKNLQTLELQQVGTETLRSLDGAGLTSLKSLTITGVGQSIFIPKAPGLESLTIINADLSAPERLLGLPATLTSLVIKGSKVTSAAFVANLVNLKTLDLSGNSITDFTRVGDLKKLTSVKASGNAAQNKICGTPAAAICEYDQITAPVTLDEFCINYLGADKAKYEASFLALTQVLNVGLPKDGASCSDIYTKLRFKRKLEIVGTNPGIGTDISPIGSLKSLNSLSLKNFGVVDVKPLANLTNMDSLDLSQNFILDPKPLEALIEMQELNLSKNQIASMNSFNHVILRRLILDGNKLTGVQTLGSLPELRTLSFANQPGFKDIKGLGKLGKLKQLNVGKTDVTDLQTLEPMVGLEIDAPEEAVKAGCPVLLGSCISSAEGVVSKSKFGPVPGLRPGQKVQNNPTPAVDLPGMSLSIKLQ